MVASFNPLSRLPRGRRLTVAVRGPAGSGKSVFAASLAEAGVGRLCLFDTERKARLLPGSGGSRFDAFEIQDPDELPQFIQWALNGDGRARGYGCYALDSWTLYFGAKYRETLAALRASTGDPLAQPSAEQLQADQFLFQDILRSLCMESNACVVITDQIGARGKEEQEENELGRVLPLTIGGLEYFTDVVVELDLQMDGLELVRIGRVVKSNSPAIPLGLELRNPCFRDLLDLVAPAAEQESALDLTTRLGASETESSTQTMALPNAVNAANAVTLPPTPAVTLDTLLAAATAAGITRDQLIIAAAHYHRKRQLESLTTQEITNLLTRLNARQQRPPTAQDQTPATPSIAPAGQMTPADGARVAEIASGSPVNQTERAERRATSDNVERDRAEKEPNAGVPGAPDMASPTPVESPASEVSASAAARRASRSPLNGR